MEVPVKEGSYNICNVFIYWKKEIVFQVKKKKLLMELCG